MTGMPGGQPFDKLSPDLSGRVPMTVPIRPDTSGLSGSSTCRVSIIGQGERIEQYPDAIHTPVSSGDREGTCSTGSARAKVALHLRPECVRTEKIVDPGHGEVDWCDPNIDFSRYSSTGVIGDPTHASANLGSELWEGVVEEVSRILRDIAGERD